LLGRHSTAWATSPAASYFVSLRAFIIWVAQQRNVVLLWGSVPKKRGKSQSCAPFSLSQRRKCIISPVPGLCDLTRYSLKSKVRSFIQSNCEPCVACR
jgi:hypothetical protein